jgi:site-specific recombinase XerD
MMTLREKIVEEIARTVSPGEAVEADICLRLLIVHCASLSLDFMEATGEQLSQFLHARGNADTTIARRLSTLRKIFDVLSSWRLIEANPAMDVRRPPVGNKKVDFAVSSAAVDRLIELQQDFVDRVRAPLMHTETLILALIHLVAAGAFLSEIGGVVVEDLRDDRMVVGRDTLDVRTIWLSPQAIVAIDAAVRASGRPTLAPRDPLLMTKGRHMVDTKMAWLLLKRAIVRFGLKEAGLTPAKIHRSAAKGLVNNGLGWGAACQPCGYRRIPLTEGRPSIDALEQAIARNHPLESA